MNNLCFFVFDLDSHVNHKKLYEFLKSNYTNFTLQLFCGKKCELNEKEIIVKYYDKDENVDNILNAELKDIQSDCLVIARNLDNDNLNILNTLTEKAQKTEDIVVVEKKRNAIFSFFFKIYNIINQFLFGYTFYNSNLGVACFGKKSIDTLAQSFCPSMLTKINKWIGIDVIYVIGDCKKIKTKNNLNSLITKISLCFAIPSLLIVFWCIFNTFFNKTYIYFPCLVIIILGYILFFIYLLKLMAKIKVGDISYDKAKEIKNY